MGKGTRHQRFIKSEKSKVKLKAKKELPKGTNVTNTAFKIKKIVIREQVKTNLSNQPLSKSKLNIKELLSRLKHFNTNARTDALNGLKDLITAHQDEALTCHLGELITGVSPLVLDKEKTVRRETYKVLHMILSPLDTSKISPFFDVLCSYLRCAMTHIDTHIHEDSLLYFDVLLLSAPDLIAGNVHKILPCFLDMISKLRVGDRPGRMLMVNLKSKMTSVKWRTNVLQRLLQFLQGLVNIRNPSRTNNKNNSFTENMEIFDMQSEQMVVDENCTHVYDKTKSNYFSLHREILPCKLACFSRNRGAQMETESEGEKLKSYTAVLIPLLFETWLEIRPSGAGDAKKVDSVISEEAVLLLKYILQIFLLLWCLSKLTEVELRNTDITKWFVNTYQKDFTQYMVHSFPYTQGVVQRNKKGVIPINQDEKCIEENLVICHIYTLLNGQSYSKVQQNEIVRIIKYVELTIGHMSNVELSCQRQIVEVLRSIVTCQNWAQLPEMIPLLDKVIAVYRQTDVQTFRQRIFTLLCGILLNNTLKCLQQTSCFQAWLFDLPNVICNSSSISDESFNIINRFAIQSNDTFNMSIKSKLKQVIYNLPNIKILGMSDEKAAKRKVIGLLYWIKNWDTDSLNILQDQLSNQSYDEDAKEYLIDILKLKTDGLFPAN